MNKKINLLIIGAQKSGTTSLHHCLSEHTKIHMSSPQKEARFFLPLNISQQYFLRHYGIKIESKQDLLRKLMTKGLKDHLYFGEGSTAYTIGNKSIKFDIPQKVFKYNPKVKIVYIIRNPLARIVSSYKHEVRRNLHNRNWNDFLDSQVFHDNIVNTSRYYFQLQLWLKYFSLESIHVIFFEDFTKFHAKCLSKLWKFLEIEPQEVLTKKYNVSLSNQKLYFTEKVYSKLYPILEKDCSRLSDLIGIDVKTKWDLSKDLWVQ